jgi:hypothetical protein
MMHPTHIEETSDFGAATKVAAILIVLALLCGVGAYVVYGSGMWAPQPVQTTNY